MSYWMRKSETEGMLKKRDLLLLLLMPNYGNSLKKTENCILLKVSEIGPSTVGKDLKKKEDVETKKVDC